MGSPDELRLIGQPLPSLSYFDQKGFMFGI
jgi:hypothetical protein